MDTSAASATMIVFLMMLLLAPVCYARLNGAVRGADGRDADTVYYIAPS